MKIFLVSLGCDKNRVDSEEMLGLLKGAGFSFCNDETEADVIIINTCCFIDAAKEESIETILEMAEMKTKGCCRRLVVTGCMAERYKEEILKELPEVDAIVALKDLAEVIGAVDPDSEAASDPSPEQNASRVLTTPGHYEFLKVADGCDKRCTYCIIPYIRGGYKSRAMEELILEAEYLAAQGVKELILVAQETTVYGTDLYGKKMLPRLLDKLCAIEGIEWIRLLYTYPEEIDDELIETIASQKKILHYLDMPIQHASDKILKRMGRRTHRADLEAVISKLRERIPDIALRTSLISGFPGEDEEDQIQMLDFVAKTGFDRLGVFTYSQEEGTPAASFEEQVPEEIKEYRKNEIMQLQAQISAERMSRHIGETLRVIVEGYLPDDDIYVGRTYMDTPDVDGFIYFECRRSLMTGDFVDVICTHSDEYDLYGEIKDESA